MDTYKVQFVARGSRRPIYSVALLSYSVFYCSASAWGVKWLKVFVAGGDLFDADRLGVID